MAGEDPSWQPLRFGGLRDRLATIKKILEQAAAVGLATDVARLESAAEEAHQREREQRAQPQRRRYR
jgi:hypothetical protein